MPTTTLPELEIKGREWSDKTWLLENFFDRDLRDKERGHPFLQVLAEHKDLRAVFGGVLGFGRSYPPELLNDEIVLDVWLTIARFGIDGAVQFWREKLTPEMRGIMRAILINLSKKGMGKNG